MAATTPRRSSRLPHTHTPKLSDRKKGLFQSDSEPRPESLTKHRKLPVVDSESDSEECDLGIISTLDSSSDENDHSTPKTPERTLWHETRIQTRKFLKENQELKNFLKSPFTLKKYQNRYSNPEPRCTGSVSTPVTPHLQNHPGTPSSTHSCTSAHTTSSTSSRARKSLASLIADTESCSSSLKDLNFDTDSGTESKENTPTKSVRRSNRTLKLTPKFCSFKGILLEQKKNEDSGSSPGLGLLGQKNFSPVTAGISPMKMAVVCLTKMDMSSIISPSQILKTPQNTTETDSPPKIGHNRRSVVEIGESPESACDSEKSYKRLRNESITEIGPISKYPRLENAPKARLSLFNCDRLKEILSTKSFYGKTNPELNTTVTVKISNAIEATTNHHKKPFHSHSKRKRKPGQINLGVKHKIRKPKHHKNKIIVKYNTGKANNSTANSSIMNSTVNSTISNATNDATMISQNSSQEIGNDKHDMFDKEKQTIEALLSQWDEEDIPESELTYSKPKELPCFSSSVIEETKQIFQPVTAVQVTSVSMPQDNGSVIVELGGKITSLSQNGQLQTIAVPSTVPQELTMTMSLNGTATSQHETIISQNGTTLSQNGTTSSRNEMTMAQNGTATSRHETIISQNGMTTLNLTTMPQNVMTMPQNVMTMPQNGMTDSSVTDALQDVVMAEVESHAANHGSAKSAQFLPVEGGYILVEENGIPEQEELPDLDEIERELKMLDEQILKMAHTNNINAEAVLASTEIAVVNDAANKAVVSESSSDDKTKLFPIFSKPNPGVTTPPSKGDKSNKKALIKTGNDQYVIDAGQKKFGATQCSECGTIYQIGDPQDEHDHLVHHNATDVLRFNGWKEECVIERTDTWRCIRVRGGDPNWRRVETLLNRVIHPQLGYEGPLANRNIHSMTAYLCIVKKQIVGCLIAETKTKAYKLIPGEPDCCSVQDYLVKCGISRIWTHLNHRRQGFARLLLDCARASFLYGEALRIEDLAFSAPTTAGKAFASKYCGTENFYVYLD